MPEKAFPQTHAGMVEALEFVEAEVSGLEAELVDRVVLVAGEAFANAVEHGGEHPNLAIRVDVHRDVRQLELTILEPVAGVGVEQLVLSDLPADPLALSGRGLFLIRALTDDVQAIGDRGLRYTFRPRSPT